MKLETSRLLLRDWEQKDINDLIEGLDNFSVSKWLAFVPHPYTKQEAELWLKHCHTLLQADINSSEYQFAIELKSEKKVIGGTCLIRIDRYNGTAGGGIWVNEKYHGHGYGREAWGERIRFAFEDLKLRRLEDGFFVGNDASKKMQESFGFKIEGEKRQAYKCKADGKLKNEIITGLLIEDWIKG